MMEERFISSEQMVEEITAEVQRISDAFQFILKYREQFQPSGIEFSDLRQYNPGDDASRIDWRSSARLNDLYVKEYEEEQNMDVFIIMDVSDTTDFGTADKLKSEYFATVAATIAYASVDMNVNVGIGMFGDDITFLSPDGGQTQYQKILREVTNPDNFGGTFNFEESLNELLKRVKDNTFVFILSDFIDFDHGDWEPKLKVVNSKYRKVFTLMIRDRRDYELPKTGNMRFKSPSGDQRMVVDTNRFRDRFNEEARRKEDEVEEKLRAGGSEFVKIDTRDSFAAEILSYFDQAEGSW
ncbi:MAG: DUF58 domain-containing protein [Candidatus Nanohaloarchaea archaeon]